MSRLTGRGASGCRAAGARRRPAGGPPSVPAAPRRRQRIPIWPEPAPWL